MKKQIICALLILMSFAYGAENLSNNKGPQHVNGKDQFMILPNSRTTKTYKPNASLGDPQYTPFGLEIKNKTGKAIWVAVANAQIHSRQKSVITLSDSDDPLTPSDFKGSFEGDHLTLYLIPNGKSGAFALDTAFTSAIAIWTKHAVDKVLIQHNHKLLDNEGLKWIFYPSPSLVIQTKQSALGKTVYITVDEIAPDKARPQTGPAMGLSGRTDTGLKLDTKKNVTKDDLAFFTFQEGSINEKDDEEFSIDGENYNED